MKVRRNQLIFGITECDNPHCENLHVMLCQGRQVITEMLLDRTQVKELIDELQNFLYAKAVEDDFK